MDMGQRPKERLRNNKEAIGINGRSGDLLSTSADLSHCSSYGIGVVMVQKH